MMKRIIFAILALGLVAGFTAAVTVTPSFAGKPRCTDCK